MLTKSRFYENITSVCALAQQHDLFNKKAQGISDLQWELNLTSYDELTIDELTLLYTIYSFIFILPDND